MLIEVHRMFPSRGIFHEVEHFVQQVKASQANPSEARSSTTKLALRDLGFIQACVNDSNTWTSIDDMLQ